MDSGIGNSKTGLVSSNGCSDNETFINSDDWEKINSDITMSPPSESLLSKKFMDANFENLTIVNKKTQNGATQTKLNVSEDTDRARNVLKHVNLLRSLLSVNQFTLVNRFGKKKNFPSRRSKRRNRLRRAASSEECNIEVIDITSSPEALDRREKNSRTDLVKKDVQRKLNFHEDMDCDARNDVSGSERLRFTLRNSEQEEALLAVQEVVDFLAAEILTRPEYTTDNWTGSLIELSADTLIRIADSGDSRVVRLVTRLCCHLLDDIVQEKQPQLTHRMESIANVVLKLCESLVVALEVADYLLTIMARIEDTLINNKAKVLQFVAVLENSFHVLRILTTIFKRFEEKSATTGSSTTPKPKADTNILKLWRAHWRPVGEDIAPPKPSQPSSAVNDRLQKLQHLLRFSLEHAPLLSPFIMESLECIRKVHIRDTLAYQADSHMGSLFKTM